MDNITMDNGKLKIENEQLPKGWVVKKLVDVCIVERGSSPRPIKKYLTDDENGVNWIKIGDTKNIEKYIYKTNQKITKEGAKKSRFVEEGDFILSNSMSYGKPYIVKTKGYIHDGWFKLKLHDFVDAEYFYQLLSSPLVNDQFKNLASGSVVKNISGDLVKKVTLPIPPLTQQKQIVKILDQAFTAIDKAKNNAQQNLLNAKQLFESYLQNVFENKGDDWVEKEWNELIEIRSGRNQKEVLNPNGKYPILGSAGKVMGYADKFICEANTTIIGRKGTINNPLFITTRFWNVDTAFGLQVGDKLTSKFLYYFCKSFDFTEMDKGSGRPSLVKTDLLKIKMSYPSITEQEKIIIKIDAFHSQTKKLESIYEQKIADLEELKKSILQKAFSGALTN